MRSRPPFAATVILAALHLPAAPAAAHDGTGGHVHAPVQTLTPRDARTHETGQLPRASAAQVRPDNSVTMTVEGGRRVFIANGVPDHATGPFPNPGNPNAISAQSYVFRMPLDPAPPRALVTEAGQATPDRGFLFGIALNGVPFEPATGLNWTPQGLHRGGRPQGWVYEAIGSTVDFGVDGANAHVQRTGAYHYHGVPTPLIRDDAPTLVGYAADGYPIYGSLGYRDPADASSGLARLESSWHLRRTPRPAPPEGPGGAPDGSFTQDWVFVAGSGDLDRLNGRFGVTPEYPGGVYHYVLTETFPFIPRGFAGTPDRSFFRTPGEGPNHVSQRNAPLALGARRN